ncbi:RasGEF domain-containing protein [Legionella jordanis]|uniref:RasGEF domain protein n=1 Tax=Legionella jordanis TaxID=456 RepID=A0A0W0V9M8_9GAMM|nr:RasGEF domain-containing protein [Legionella jordanis]KTD16573.1 RasGEF domain protein [Legionella jordanis]RMX03888.1 hypothetical protein EAW55_05895 [Legionella jordanis]VEH11964.1 RasGEF domain [Legionella jordanis]
MNKELIQALVFSKHDEKKIIKKLCKWFKSKPSLIDETYVLDRTVFHLLVLKGKFKALKALLDYPEWQRKGLQLDRNGCSLLHYAARYNLESSSSLSVLMGIFPELVNLQNKAGNTALHEAVLAKNLLAIKALLADSEVDRSLQNEAGFTAFMLTADDLELKRPFLYIDLSLLKSLNLRSQKNTVNVGEEFKYLFPLMSSRSSNYSPSASLETSPSTSRLSEPTSSVLSFHPVQNEQNIGQTPIKNQTLWQAVIEAYKTDRNSEHYFHLQKEFNAFCSRFLLADSFDLEHEQDEDTRFAAKQVIHNALNELYPLVDEHYSKSQNEIYSLLKLFIQILINHAPTAEDEAKAFPECLPQSSTDLKLMTELWDLTVCQANLDSSRESQIKTLNEITLGLLSAYPLTRILICIRVMFPHFDFSQKLMGNFIALQALIYSGINLPHLKPLVATHLRLLCKKNVDPEIGLANLGEQLNQLLHKALELSSLCDSNLLYQNYCLLSEKINQPSLRQTNQSFDELVACALKRPRQERRTEVLILAHELRMLTRQFYQDVTIHEFDNCSWLKDSRNERSPHIVQFTAYFNKLSSYFTEKLLSQTADNMQNALQFLLDLAQALCPLGEETYPDLNHLMLIYSVLNNINISRMTRYFEELPTKDKKIIAEIDQILSQEKNKKYLRYVYNKHRTALPFLGSLLTDISFAHEGNDNSLIRKETVGSILKKILELKVLLNFEVIHFESNLPEYLAAYLAPSEEELYYCSLQHQPKISDVIDFDQLADNLESFLERLNNNYLSHNLLPPSIFEKKSYTPGHFLDALINYLHHQSKKNPSNFPARHQEDLQRVMHKIIQVNNEFYYPKNLSNKLNPIFYEFKLGQLHSEDAFTIPTDAEPSAKKETKRHRRSKSLLTANSIFKPEQTDIREGAKDLAPNNAAK